MIRLLRIRNCTSSKHTGPISVSPTCSRSCSGGNRRSGYRLLAGEWCRYAWYESGDILPPLQSQLPSAGPSLHRRSSVVHPQSKDSFRSFSFTSLCRSHSHRLSPSRPLTSGGFSFTFSWKSSAHGTQGYSRESEDNSLSMLFCVSGGARSG